jgi:hypothetical protein
MQSVSTRDRERRFRLLAATTKFPPDPRENRQSPTKSSFRQPDEHFMMVLNHGRKDFLPIRFPQSGYVGFEIVHGIPVSPTSSDIAQVGPVCGHRINVRRHVAVGVVVFGDGECGGHWPLCHALPGARKTPSNLYFVFAF